MENPRVEPSDRTKSPYKGKIFFWNRGEEGRCRYILQGLDGSENCGYRNSNTSLLWTWAPQVIGWKSCLWTSLGIKSTVSSYEGLSGCHTPHTGVAIPVSLTSHWRGGWRISVTQEVSFRQHLLFCSRFCVAFKAWHNNFNLLHVIQQKKLPR